MSNPQQNEIQNEIGQFQNIIKLIANCKNAKWPK